MKSSQAPFLDTQVKNASKKNSNGFALALAAAGLLASHVIIPTATAAESVLVNCMGLKGGSGCGNSCPEKRTELMSERECIQKGGKPSPLEASNKEEKRIEDSR